MTEPQETIDLSWFPVFRQQAMDAFSRGDAARLLGYLDNTQGLDFVNANRHALKHRGIYESALVSAYCGTRTNWAGYSLRELESFFQFADPSKLRAAGTAFPDGRQFKLYRGVSGVQPHRKVSGLSWTRSLEQAAWFAKRHPDLTDPAVYEAIALPSEIYCYINDRDEEEFVFRAKRYRRIDDSVWN